MPVRTKKTKAKRTKKVKKSAAKKTIAKKTKAKKSAAKKTAKKAVAKTSPTNKTVKKQKQGKSTPTKTSAKKAASKRATRTPPAEKTAWKISPEISQSVVDIDIWKKGDLKIEHLTVYRTGWIVVHQLPDLSSYNPDEGVSIFEKFEFEEHEVLDGSQETSSFPKELPSEECERLMALSEEELVDEGWTIESATRFSGPLVVEEVEALPSA
jgi:hypothetical protein